MIVVYVVRTEDDFSSRRIEQHVVSLSTTYGMQVQMIDGIMWRDVEAILSLICDL